MYVSLRNNLVSEVTLMASLEMDMVAKVQTPKFENAPTDRPFPLCAVYCCFTGLFHYPHLYFYIAL